MINAKSSTLSNSSNSISSSSFSMSASVRTIMQYAVQIADMYQIIQKLKSNNVKSAEKEESEWFLNTCRKVALEASRNNQLSNLELVKSVQSSCSIQFINFPNRKC